MVVHILFLVSSFYVELLFLPPCALPMFLL
jgi:hypothetical protein